MQKVELAQALQLAGQVTQLVEERMKPVAQALQAVVLGQDRQLEGQERQLLPVK